ncbi:hypothetical protein AVEN_115601-1 [Araneus ventricosus]|uniref:Uncharacterized protein n=1 Tax=Araneus ventricosus TaxID=182803 RepID=A0A4Y2N0Q8_ARAVE|nr:hypothetical protein AVEN_115601-1 [Araneus ventricosus]
MENRMKTKRQQEPKISCTEDCASLLELIVVTRRSLNDPSAPPFPYLLSEEGVREVGYPQEESITREGRCCAYRGLRISRAFPHASEESESTLNSWFALSNECFTGTLRLTTSSERASIKYLAGCFTMKTWQNMEINIMLGDSTSVDGISNYSRRSL